MRKEYDFSKGVRGKFFHKNAQLYFPVYLEPEVFSLLEKIAKKKKSDISTVVNDLIKTDIKIANYIK